MPDKWEYPWYAAWDLAFHALALSVVDLDFAKQQLEIVLSGRYLHPSGQVPAYEWNFSDVNPPVHAWATLFLYRTEQGMRGRGDLDFLKSAFAKLMLNFTWWVNRKDRFGKNVFEGGFLGLDNISVFDRSSPLPTGGYLEQADGTAWMCLFCQNMGELALELASEDPAYLDLVSKFLDHFLFIAAAMNRPGYRGDVGRRGRLLLRSITPSRRHLEAAQGAFDRRSATAVRYHGDGALAAQISLVGALFSGETETDARDPGNDSPYRSRSFRCGGARDNRPAKPPTAAPRSDQDVG